MIILSAKRSVDDRVKGLQTGSDDYLTKPFALSELVARIQALLRRSSSEPQPTRLAAGDLVMDLVTRDVTRGASDRRCATHSIHRPTSSRSSCAGYETESTTTSRCSSSIRFVAWAICSGALKVPMPKLRVASPADNALRVRGRRLSAVVIWERQSGAAAASPVPGGLNERRARRRDTALVWSRRPQLPALLRTGLAEL